MRRIRLLLSLLVVASIMALCLPLFDMVYLYPSATSLITEKARQDAGDLGNYLAENYKLEADQPEITGQLQSLADNFSLVRASLRTVAGTVRESTDPAQIGQQRDMAAFTGLLHRGQTYSRLFTAVVVAGEPSRSLIETQAPLMVDGQLVAVLELIFDSETIRQPLEQAVSRASLFLLLVGAVFISIILVIFCLARQAVKQQEQSDVLLQANRQLLEKKHQVLNATFRLVEQAKYEWQMTLDCISEMILLVDDNGRICRCNQAFIRFVDLSYFAVLGKNWRAILRADGLECPSANQHTEVFHAKRNLDLIFDYYQYQNEQGQQQSVIRIQKKAAMREG